MMEIDFVVLNRVENLSRIVSKERMLPAEHQVEDYTN
jgi:hypothetical protein